MANTRDLLSLEHDTSDDATPVIANSSSADLNSAVASIGSTKLPSFWRHSPIEWFLHAEAVFANGRIRSDVTRTNHVLSALDEDGVKTVRDLIGANVKYEDIKERLVNTYSVSQSTRFRAIAQSGGLGDRRPSQMLRDLRAVLPDGIGDAALKEFWLQKLPQSVLTVISGLDGNLQQLAERADRIMDASQGHEVHAVARNSSNDRFRAIEGAILALTSQIASLATSQTDNNQRRGRSWSRARTRSKSRPREQPTWCFYHKRFAADAKRCRSPCSYTSGN